MNIKNIIFVVLAMSSLSTASHARDWYFDKDSIGGTCKNTGPGTITQPFCSVFYKLHEMSWNEPQAGDTIYLRGGTYGGRQFWIKSGVLNNGTPNNPITIRPYPGETVIFDGALGSNDLLINIKGSTNAAHDLSFIGPFEAKNYIGVFNTDAVLVMKYNFIFDNWTVHHCGYGFMFRMVNGGTVKNSYFYELKGVPGSTTMADNTIAVSAKANATLFNDNILVENCTAHDINDGRGNDDGDGGAFHTDGYCINATFRNLVSYRNSEDGLDTKAQNVTIENVISHSNGATGIKLWGGNLGRASTYKVSNVLTYNNTETGLKCSGNGDIVTAQIDHLTAWACGEESLKNTEGYGGSNDCNMTVRNSIIGEGGNTAVHFRGPLAGYTGQLHLINTNLSHNGSTPALTPTTCPGLPNKYSLAQYTGGIYHTDMTAIVNCTDKFGTLSGSAVNPTSFNPDFVDVAPVFKWAGVTTGEVTSNTLTYWIQPQYPWPNPAIGSYIEIDDDGVKRQITAVGNAGNPTITFSPAVTTAKCGRVTDCFGVRVTGWDTGATFANNFSLASGSPAINAGVFVNGLHCALADDNGGSGLTGCIHWNGTSPDLGYKEFGLLQSSTLPKPQIKAISPY